MTVAIGVLQMTAGIDPDVNAGTIVAAIEQAAAAGAAMVFTPEMSGLLDRDATRAAAKIVVEDDDPVLGRVRAAAAKAGLWVNIGSLALRGGADGRFVNRSLVIDPSGDIVARYDKVHLFDVDLGNGETWRESARYAAGDSAVTVATPLGRLGLSICYDLRFPALYQMLSAAGARVLVVPAAFTVPTGRAHWHVLLRARAVENAAFVVAAAQVGDHVDGRTTYGHSLVIDPWGQVILDMGDEAGLSIAVLELGQVDEVRKRIPVLAHRRTVAAPTLMS